MLNKKIFLVLVIVSLLALPVTSAFRAVDIPITVQMVSASLSGKGLVFRFMINGTFRPNDLIGRVTIGNKTVNLKCNVKSGPQDKLLTCSAPLALPRNVTSYGTVVMANHAFGFSVQGR